MQQGASGAWDSPLTTVPLQPLQLPTRSRLGTDAAASLAACFPDEDKRRMWSASAAALLDHAGMSSSAENMAHSMALDADLESAMQLLNPDFGLGDDAEKVCFAQRLNVLLPR